MNLQEIIKEHLKSALNGYVDDVDGAASQLKPTQDPKHGDYQANCAMGLAKVLGKKPREIAQQIVERLPQNPALPKPEIAGPGFINFRIDRAWLEQQCRKIATDERLGVQLAKKTKTFVIDFSSPNVAKPLHVGHLRSTIIGESLARILRFAGHKVIADNHLGDWGTQFGMILFGYKNFRDEKNYKQNPVEELARLYKEVRKMMKGDEDATGASPVAEACRMETAKLHSGDAENVKLWQEFMPHCLAEIEAIYQRLDIHFDVTLGESFYNPMLPAVVDELLAKKVAKESLGAIAIFFGEEEPPAIVRKKDGAYTYTTTDLATIKYRVEKWQPDEVLYVVDSRQALHFQNLFNAARRCGFDQVELKHISFGSVLGEDRKPLSTREGTGASLEGLLNDSVTQAAKTYQQNREERLERGEDVPELSPEELRELEESVGIGAVKYSDMCQNRVSDYVFSMAKMLAMSGNTATYMQYAYVRCKGIFRRGEEDAERFRHDPPPLLLETPEECSLALKILQLEEALQIAMADYQPSAITSYLWELAKAYSTFFAACPVLKAPTKELRDSRLLLCDLTARTIKLGLNLLGIRTPERM